MAAPVSRVSTTARVKSLRDLMTVPERNLQAYVVPSEDQHSSEYLADCDERRAYITGFTGSAGLAIVCSTGANHLFTDGRYFLQASQQLDENWTLQKQGVKGFLTWQEFLEKKLPEGSRIGVDPCLISAGEAKDLETRLAPKQSSIVPVNENLVDIVWGDKRPKRPRAAVFHLEDQYSGLKSSAKLDALRQRLAKEEANAVVVTMLDEIAWLFNLRGSDILYNPVFFAYAVVTLDGAILFLDPSQTHSDLRSKLGASANIQPYDSFFPYLDGLRKKSPGKQEIVVGKQASWAVVNALGRDKVKIMASPIADAKAIKNSVELEGFRDSHIRDGAALVRYFSWLEKQLEKQASLSECDAADQLEKYRSALSLFEGLSFPTISGVGSNAAIIHYSPQRDSAAQVTNDMVYLCDSGAQFRDGTTDVTRTWHFGNPTDKEIRTFTRVLQGHIAIDTVVFPEGTTGYVIDSFARQALWKDGLDFRHGTGHGVGHFLNVHEGPHGIGTRIALNETALKPGMVLSNEPGYYEEGKFGIRIENVGAIKKAKTPFDNDDRDFFGFEHFTMCPIQTKLVDASLLTPDERSWLNAYHKEVFDKVSPLLVDDGDEIAREWLQKECKPI